MSYCINCGQELADGAKFCANCGKAVNDNNSTTQRKTIYDGEIHKCPNCGEVLSSFVTVCPTCGHELRGTTASNSVRELALKLQQIESGRTSKNKTLFGRGGLSKQTDDIDEQKINLIKSFAIPNTKEDILEFAVLAASNVDRNSYDESYGYLSQRMNARRRDVSNAWMSKLEQAYQKAKIVLADDPRLNEIQTLYDSTHKAVNKVKWRMWKTVGVTYGILFGVFLLIFIMVGIGSCSDRNAEKKEEERLNAIVIEIEEALDAGDYRLALMNADSLYFREYNTDLERDWEIKRDYWIDKVIEKAAEDGIILERPTDIKESEEEKERTDDIIEDVETITYEPISVKNYTFNMPSYWKEEGSKNEYLQYYAEKGDKVMMLSIAYPEETDDNYNVSFDTLYADNNNMVEAVGAMFTNGDVIDYEILETNSGIKGILYRFTYMQEIDSKTKADGSGYCFCYPSENDRRWFYVVLLHTNNVASDRYKDDYMNLLYSITKESDSTIINSAVNEKTQSEDYQIEENTITDNKIEKFTVGYEKANFDKYNSPASENGLGGSRIYFNCLLEKTEVLESDGTTTILGYVKDENDNEWLIMMHSLPFVTETAFDSYIGKDIVVRGVYSGFSSAKNMPAMVLDEFVIIGTGETVAGMQKILDLNV